ncbi:hypothetical protein CHU92_14480 [Flavobacterium cyanobacteriorum]|uniref:Alginate export domain-containing protein n=1 Tax=Flavobacterium cyanobacteriorum TaxID=2022802 RepID=A0A255YS95_9FLAO|nr:alginate export family protein [Flavobacterium cyanobacteriorum]OYQ32082.1 hypothetical protein CHU92_14480 [Flavobacterium cyanobacteriorum]
MKAALLTALLALYCPYLRGQEISFRPLRYEEDHALYADDTVKSFYKKLKYTQLSAEPAIALSVGGELRLQYQFYDNENWGDAPDDHDGYLLTRSLLHADVRFSKAFRVFTQLQSSLASGRIDPNPLEHNPLELHQFFADAVAGRFTLRAGRQEFLYGSQRLIAVREGPNSRQSFDAVKVIYNTKDWQADAFYSQFVRNFKGNFNDRMNPDTKLWGFYNIIRLHQGFIIDLYYLGLYRKRGIFDDAAGTETRHSAGMRFSGKKAGWKHDAEALYQFGSSEDKAISAWTVSLNSSYQFNDTPLKPVLGIKTEYISGDREYDDNSLNTFNPLFPRGAYFGLAALIGPANLFDVHPFAELQVTEKIAIGLDYDFFWRASLNDGIYSPNTALIYTGRNSRRSHIGNQLGFEAGYAVNGFIELKAEGTWFDAGRYLKESGAGKDVLFFAATATLKL